MGPRQGRPEGLGHQRVGVDERQPSQVEVGLAHLEHLGHRRAAGCLSQPGQTSRLPPEVAGGRGRTALAEDLVSHARPACSPATPG